MKLPKILALAILTLGFSLSAQAETTAPHALRVDLIKDGKAINGATFSLKTNTEAWLVSSSTTAIPYVINGDLLTRKTGLEVKVQVIKNVVSYDISYSELTGQTIIKDSSVPTIQGVTLLGSEIVHNTTSVKVDSKIFDTLKFTFLTDPFKK